jgi:type II secretory pathway pseudopilin PulG
MMNQNNKGGFTLIEAVVYIALFSILMAGVLLSTYQIFQASGSLANKTTAQEEGNFVLRKLDWALSGASSVVPAANALTVSRYDGNTVDFRLNNGAVEMRESASGLGYLPITTPNVSVSNLTFTLVGSNPAGVAAITTINGIDFATTKYIRK